jgi:hypothetical protein
VVIISGDKLQIQALAFDLHNSMVHKATVATKAHDSFIDSLWARRAPVGVSYAFGFHGRVITVGDASNIFSNSSFVI